MQPPISKLVIATHNMAKFETLQGLLRTYGVAVPVLSLADLNIKLDVAETGTTIEENATLKAQTYAQETGYVCLSDDTSFEIDALNGQPGIHANRFAGPHATDEQKRQNILHQLASVTDQRERTARFRSALVVAWPDNTSVCAIGHVEGRISMAISSTHIPQYPYCSIFIPHNETETIAELMKDGPFIASEHRRLALEELLRKISFTQ